MPNNMPLARGIGFTMRSYVDTDHEGNSITQRLRTTGFLIYLDSSLIFYWYSEKRL